MKVLFVSHMFPSASRTTLGTFVRDYADAIRNSGIEVGVLRLATALAWPIGSFGYYRTSGRILASEAPNVRAIKFPVLPALAAFNIYSARTQNRITEAAVEFKPDIIHSHNLFPDAALSIAAKKATNARLVVTTHGTDNRVHIHRSSRLRWVEQALAETDHLIAVSGKILREFSEAGIYPRKCSVIYNGFSQGPRSAEVTKRPGRTALCVCHLDLIEKGVDILIQAFGRLHSSQEFVDCRLVIVGAGRKSGKLKALANAVGVGASTEFMGALEPSGVHEEFARCDLFCMPSWYEAFGVVYLEAMSHGKPVIAVAGQGISEVLRDGETALLVEPRSIESCTAALERLFRDPVLRERIGSAGLRRVAQFTWEHAAAETVAIYEDLLAGVRRPPTGHSFT